MTVTATRTQIGQTQTLSWMTWPAGASTAPPQLPPPTLQCPGVWEVLRGLKVASGQRSLWLPVFLSRMWPTTGQRTWSKRVMCLLDKSKKQILSFSPSVFCCFFFLRELLVLVCWLTGLSVCRCLVWDFICSMSSLAPRGFYELGGVVLFDGIIKRINSQLMTIWCWAFVGRLILASCRLWLLCLRHMLPLFFSWLPCCTSAENVFTCLTGCLSRAAVGKHSPPSVAPWRWTTSKTCVLTAFSRRYTMIPRTKTMRWATPTPSRTICMHARWASNLSLLAMTVMTSSYQSSGHLKKIFTYRRSNWDHRGDPGTRRYKVSGLLITMQPEKRTLDHVLLFLKSKFRLQKS